jgi:tRNA-intron endonuclease
MSSDLEFQVYGNLIKNKTIIKDQKIQNGLIQKGYGDTDNDDYFLNMFETLYLLYSKKLKLTKGKSLIDFDNLMQICIKSDTDIFTKFLIFRDLRTRGYVVKEGFGFGSDFRVYERGNFGTKSAKYLVFALNEGTQEKIGQIQKNIFEITQMGKEPIIAVIERRGEVIYYKISKMTFLENKSDLQMKDFKF